ncbi:MAG: response regulator transcription factor, partial [Chloroflexi bacterium]|nr:response regulator transcription factor [Chloroflexota bacterium]
MTAPRVLVVDDEPQIRRALRVGLTGLGYDVQSAGTGEEGLDLAAVAPPDVVILDLMLPGMSGLEVCKALREWSQAPIIVLSAKGGERDKVEALDLGADDYLTKPFGMDELLARIRVALRRTTGEASSPVLESGDLRLDQVRRLVTSRGQEVHLTPTEYDMLRYLLANAGKVVTHRALLRAVWGPGYEDGSQTLRFFIVQLRRKIEPDPSRPTYIRTEPGIGYRFRADA